MLTFHIRASGMRAATAARGARSSSLRMVAVTVACTAISHMAVAANARREDAPEPIALEEIVVTGSLLRDPDVQSVNPVTTLDRAYIERTGATTTQDLLHRVTLLQASPVSVGGSQGKQGDGGFLSLRNLGAVRTLVLLNGRRLTPTLAASGAVGFDVNAVPLSMVERIEVLRDGASMVYGSDAIGGVINIITKPEFDGVDVKVGAASSTHGDRDTGTGSVAIGKQFERGGFMLGADWTKAEAARYGQRPEYQPLVTGVGRDANGQPIITSSGSAISNGGIILGNGLGAAPQYTFTGPGQYRAYQPSDNSNTGSQVSIAPEQQSAGANLLAHFDLSSNISAYAEAMYTSVITKSNIDYSTLGSGFLVVPASNPFNPFGTTVRMQRFATELGSAEIKNDASTRRAVAGLSGLLDEGRFHWDVSYAWGENRNRVSYSHQQNTANLAKSLDPALCATDPACTLANVFGPGTLSAEAQRYIDLTDVDRTEYLQRTAKASIDGELFSLPAGALTGALGIERRTESGSFTPDSFRLTGQSSLGPSQRRGGGYHLTEAYTEFGIPVLADLPGVKTLTLNVGARYSDYDTFGDTTTWKAGLSWAVSEDVRFRANRSTGFRAPNILELFTSETVGIARLPDPCAAGPGGLRSDPVVDANCLAAGVPANYISPFPPSPIATHSGGNPTLQPETSQSTNVGIVLTPRWIPRFNLGVDYYRIKLTDTIAMLDPLLILSQCYQSGELCGQLNRDPVTHAPTDLYLQYTNLGSSATDGFDVNAGYDFPLGAATIILDSQSTYVRSFEQQNLPGGVTLQYAGKLQPNGAVAGSFPRLRSNLTVTYARTPWSVSWTTRFISAMEVFVNNDPQTNPYNRVGAVAFHDLSAQWRLGKVDLTVGAQNLFDKETPLAFSSIGLRDFATYDPIGRLFFAKASTSF